MDFITQRFNSDSGESISVAQLLWIMFAVVIVIGLGSYLYKAMHTKARVTADCINNANTYINGSQQNQNGIKRMYTQVYILFF